MGQISRKDRPISDDDAQRVTQKYLDPDRLQIVAVGDGKSILPALRKFGPIRICDTEGKRRSLGLPRPFRWLNLFERYFNAACRLHQRLLMDLGLAARALRGPEDDIVDKP